MALEAECRNFEKDDRKEMDENYSFTMTLDKGKHFGTFEEGRYERDLELVEKLKKQKTDEKDKIL